MNSSNPSAAIAIAPHSPRPSPAHQRVIRRILRTERELLVDVARRHLGALRQDAEDLVHDVYLAALQGDLYVSSKRAYALDDLLHAVISAADRQANGDAP
jgi:DNA-directed RNA polymerase specialized sigma24 family protein